MKSINHKGHKGVAKFAKKIQELTQRKTREPQSDTEKKMHFSNRLSSSI